MGTRFTRSVISFIIGSAGLGAMPSAGKSCPRKNRAVARSMAVAESKLAM
jgi:hypothetical protein